jgi:predicted nuclease of predicted toxin-antitoxin system
MKLLLDECVTRRLKRDLDGGEHAVFTVDQAGLKGLKNGSLLRAMNGKFDVLVTLDQNLPYQQNLSGRRVAVIVLAAKNSAYASLKPLVPHILETLRTLEPGRFVRLCLPSP